MEELCLRDDEERGLVRGAVDGNERAFRKILEKHYRLIYSVVHGVAGRQDETEDIVQEVFVKIFRALPEFRGEARLSTWIYRIARNEAVNALEKRKLQTVPIEDCDDLPASEESPAATVQRMITRERLERLMKRLDEKQRLAIELRYRGEKSYEEIADIMEIPLGTVKTYIYRAKVSLKRMMTGSGANACERGFGES